MTDSPVVALTYFEGVIAPMVEIWTPLPKSSECAADVPQSHGYMRLNQPPCATDKEWFEMLRRAERTVFLKAAPNEPAPEAATHEP